MILSKPLDRGEATSLAKNLLASSGGTLVFFGASLVRNVFLARVIGPLDFGAWTLGLVFLQYGQWSHLSLLNAFRLDGARAHGAGESSELFRLQRMGWTAAVFPAVLVSIAVGGLGFALKDAGVRSAALMSAGILLPLQLYSFAYSALSTEERFTVAARLQASYALINLLLTLVLAPKLGFWGAVVAQTASYLLALLIHRRKLSLYVRPLFDWSLISEQLKIGLPVALNGVVYTLFVTIDRTLVAATLGLTALGQYGLTALARSSIGLIPGALSEVLYMRAANRYGRLRTTDAILPLLRGADLRLASAVAVAIGLSVAWAPLIVRSVLPAYEPGIPALQVFLVGLFFAFPQYAAVMLTVAGRASELLILYATATGAQTMLVLLGINWLGIKGAALGTLAGTLVLFLIVNLWGFRRAHLSFPAIARHILGCLLPLTLVLLILGIGAKVPAATPNLTSFREIVVTAALALVAIVFGYWWIRKSPAARSMVQS